MTGHLCAGPFQHRQDLGFLSVPPSILMAILQGMANASWPSACVRGQGVSGFRAIKAGVSGFVSRFQDIENHVSVLGRKLGSDT